MSQIPELYVGQNTEVTKNFTWWDPKLPARELSKTVFNYVYAIDDNNMDRNYLNLRNYRLYQGSECQGLVISQFVLNRNISYTPMDYSGVKMAYNVVQVCVDTLQSKLAKNKVKAMLATKRGNWKQRRKALNGNKFLAGAFYESKVHQVTPLVLRDALIGGTGICHVFTEDNKICVERVMPDELKVDQSDALYNMPSKLVRTKLIPREALLKNSALSDTPEKREAIHRAPAVRVMNATQTTSVLIEVNEAYMLASEDGKEDGLHIICVANATVPLLKEPYTRTRFPFAKLHFKEPLDGFWGQGISQLLVGKQAEINRLLNFKRECMRLVGIPRIWLDRASKTANQTISNRIGEIGYYSGQPPFVWAGPSVPPEVDISIQSLIAECLQEVGISELSASSKSPLGANASGAAYREYHDIETERFAVLGQQYENLHCDIADLMFDEIDAMYEKDGEYKVRIYTKGVGLEEISWREIGLKKDDFVVQTYPTSALPDQIFARVEYIQELMNMGILDPAVATELMQVPDVEGAINLYGAPVRIITKMLEVMLDGGQYQEPDEFLPLPLQKKLGALYYCEARYDEAPPEILQNLRDFLIDCVNLEQIPMEASAQALPIAQQATDQSLLAGQQEAMNPEQAMLPPAM